MTTKSAANTAGAEDIPAQDIRFGFECLRNIEADGKALQVNLTGIRDAMGYSNVNSVGNRFRELRKRYGFPTLECKTGASVSPQKSATTTPEGTPTKRAAARARKTAVRKGAKVSTSTPISATKPVPKTEESEDMDAASIKAEDGDDSDENS
ncbi:hypothetical protein BJX99DRAFT_258135 [Aspergillus californicus]